MKSIVNALARSQAFANLIFSGALLGLRILFGLTAMRFVFFKNRLKEKNLTVQIKLKDNSRGRSFTFRDGRMTSKDGIHTRPDVTMIFGSARLVQALTDTVHEYGVY